MTSPTNTPEWEALRKNWVIILTVIGCVGWGIEQWATVQTLKGQVDHLRNTVTAERMAKIERDIVDMGHDLRVLQERFGVDKVSAWIERRINMERDISDLQTKVKGCK